MGITEVAHTLGITTAGVRWMHAEGRLPDCRELAAPSKRVWDAAEIRALARDRDRRDERHMVVLRHYRKTGNISAAARAAGVSRGTARRALIDVGLIDGD